MILPNKPERVFNNAEFHWFLADKLQASQPCSTDLSTLHCDCSNHPIIGSGRHFRLCTKSHRSIHTQFHNKMRDELILFCRSAGLPTVKEPENLIPEDPLLRPGDLYIPHWTIDGQIHSRHAIDFTAPSIDSAWDNITRMEQTGSSLYNCGFHGLFCSQSQTHPQKPPYWQPHYILSMPPPKHSLLANCPRKGWLFFFFFPRILKTRLWRRGKVYWTGYSRLSQLLARSFGVSVSSFSSGSFYSPVNGLPTKFITFAYQRFDCRQFWSISNGITNSFCWSRTLAFFFATFVACSSYSTSTYIVIVIMFSYSVIFFFIIHKLH